MKAQRAILAIHLVVISNVPSLLFVNASNQPNINLIAQGADDAEALYRDSMELAKSARYVLARAKLFQAVGIWQASDRQNHAVDAIFEAASYYSTAGQWQIALECYTYLLRFNNLEASRKVDLFSSVGWLYYSIRNFDLARSYYQQAVRLAQKINNHSAEALALSGLATVCSKSGQVKESIEYLDRAGSILARNKDESAEARVLLLAGQIHYAGNRITEARDSLERALVLYRKKAQNSGDESSVLSSLSGLYLIAGRKDAALESAIEALKIADNLKAQEHRWRALLAKARAQRALRQNQEALKTYFGAFSAIEMQALNLWADSLKIGFLEETQVLYRELASLLIESGRADEAFKVVEHSRSRAMLGLLSDSRSAARSREIADFKVAPYNKPQAQLRSDIEETNLQREEMRLASELGRVRRFTQPATLKQAQEALLESGDTLIEFFLTDDLSYAWLITREESRCVALPAQKDIEARVRQYIDTLALKPNSLYLEQDMTRQRKLAASLFNLLFGAFSEKLAPGRRLIIAPDGLLYYLPFETLVRDGRYLVEDHIMSYIPSASVLRLLREPKANYRPADQMELLAFGDPIYGLPRASNGNPAKKGGGEGIQPSVAALFRNRLTALPNTRDEVLTISKLFAEDRQRVYVGKSMTESVIKRAPLLSFKRLHLATHSLVDEKLPARSAVVFSYEDGNDEDGLLEVEEIVALNLACELVVLSACQTGRGRLVSGEGLIGLARAFLYAGAQSVVVTAWSVSDISTATFMKSFYHNLSAKLGSAASLRQAKLELIASGKVMRHPYYWAAFMIVGNCC